MVKYKNFGAGQHQAYGSHSFSSQNTQPLMKSTRSGKGNKSRNRSERSPSTMRREEEVESREDDGSRFDPRVVPNDSSEEETINEGEGESLYDMISYNDQNSTSACASYSYSAGDTNETDSSAGFSDPHQPRSPRRAKLSYMGYVAVSPNTAAAMAIQEMRDQNATHRTRNGNNDSDNNDSGHTGGEGIANTTGSSFPSIKVDDTSTSRRRRTYDDDSQTMTSGPTACTIDSPPNFTEHVTVGQQKCLEESEKQSKNPSSSVAEHTQNSRVEEPIVATSVQSSVVPNSCSGHPVMTKNQGLQSEQPNSQFRKPNKDFTPLSPVIASPNPSKAGAWNENASLGLSPLTEGRSTQGMFPPTLNHPPAMMHPHWNPRLGQYQQPQPVHMYPYGVGANNQQYPPQPPHPPHPPQPQQPFQSGFVPRNPMLARQLQAFHRYHNQEQHQQQEREQPSPSPPEQHGIRPIEPPVSHQNFEPVVPKDDVGMPSSKQSKGEKSESDHQPFLVCGPEGPRMMDDAMNNVKFVKPRPRNAGSMSLSSEPFLGGALVASCGQNPAAMKCQSVLGGFLNTCGAIVNHGYHVDSRKSTAKEKKAKFGKVADASIKGLAQSEKRQDDEIANALSAIGSISSGLNEVLASNAKKILNVIEKDIQNLTPSAAYNNVFDTFQRYAPMSPKSDDSVLSDDPEEAEVDNTKPMSPGAAQRQRIKSLRRRRNRLSVSTARSEGEPDPPAQSASSPKLVTSTEKKLEATVENFKDRYSQNLHTRLHNEKLERVGGIEPEGSSSKDVLGVKDVESNDSWATPISRDESTEEYSGSARRDPPEKSAPADGLQQVLGLSTSSNMSDSMVGSDLGDEEPQLNSSSHSTSSISEDEQEEHLLIDSYDHNDFPHTQLDVIEEGSEDDETTVNPPSIRNSASKDGTIDERAIETILSDELSVYEARSSVNSVIGVVRVVFVTMLLLQCGTMVCLWDQVAEHIKTMEGGQEALIAAENVVSNLKASGVSFVSTAQGMINADKIDLPVREIISKIESRTAALVGTANHFLSELAAGDVKLSILQGKKTQEEQELQLFQDLIDEAFGDDDFLRSEDSEDAIPTIPTQSLDEKSV